MRMRNRVPNAKLGRSAVESFVMNLVTTLSFGLALGFALAAFPLPSTAAVQPSDLAGTWEMEVKVDQESHQAKLVFRWENGMLSGRVQGGERDLELKALKLEGETVTFTVSTGEHDVAFTIKISGNTMEGTMKADDQTGSVKGKKQS